ncbi:MAG: hypothetical protein ACRDYV_12190, partial [Acidimicrobiia bacterium]
YEPPPPPPAAPAPDFALYQGSGPPTDALRPAPLPPAPAAVGVLDRDEAEFPGQPLPADFFHALPERARRAPRKLNRTLLVVAIVAGGAIFSGITEWSGRESDIASPARHMVAGACAEYRDILNRLDSNPDDFVAFQDSVAWFQNNRDRFVQAAVLDPSLEGAAGVVVWFDDGIRADFAPFDGLSNGEMEQREEPLVEACYTGPGRA